MFIPSLILTASPIAAAQECPEGETCERPLVILEPTSSPGARGEPEPERSEPPPVVILTPEAPEPDADDGAEDVDEDDEDDVVFVTDREPEKERKRRRRPQIMGQYAMQFLGDGPAHQLAVRYYGAKDSYIGGEIRYLPGNDSILWAGRAGAGIDLLGGGPFDLQLGLFVGSAGEWFVLDGGDALYHSPILGSEVRFAFEGHRLFTSYRLIGGLGVGPLDRFLSEREFILGYKVTQTVQLFGESVRIDPRSGDQQWSLGLGGRLVF